MKIFADLHHLDLYYSLQLLFEKRLGWELYRPIGMEWQQEGYWNVYSHPATALQYLSLEQAIKPVLNAEGKLFPEKSQLNKNYRFEEGIYYVEDAAKDKKIQRAITLDKFKSMKFDILVSSVPQHIQPFNKLIELFQPEAKHIFQIGNAWQNISGVKNILASTAPFNVSADIRTCFYHQEFDLDVFFYRPPTNHNIINSYIHYMKGIDILERFKTLLPNYKFTTYGAGMDDDIYQTSDIAKAMQDSSFTWHWKPEGDGYGYNLHNSFACGRPMIINKQHYQGKLGDLLLEDQVTCIDIGRHSFNTSASLIQKFSNPEEHQKICQNAYNRFISVVNFDEEFIQIKKFLENLL